MIFHYNSLLFSMLLACFIVVPVDLYLYSVCQACPLSQFQGRRAYGEGEEIQKNLKHLIKILVSIDVSLFYTRKVEPRIRQNAANAAGVEEIVCCASTKKREINFGYPRIKYCTDNAAMIGAAGYYAYKNGIRADLCLNAVAVDINGNILGL